MPLQSDTEDLEFFRSNLLIHTHVQKTAGTTLVEGLTASLGEHHVLDLRSGRNVGMGRHPSKLSSDQKKHIWLLSGHFNYGKMNPFFARKKIYIASVRPPFQRFRSFVDHVRRNPNHPAYAQIRDRDFSRIIEEHLRDNLPQANNQMARMMTDLDNPPLEDLFGIVESNYLFVTPYVRVNQALQSLIAFVGAPPLKRDLHKNKAPRKPPEDVGDLEAEFNKANQLDQKLYEYAEQNFDRWISSFSERLDGLSSGQRQAT